jgi:hypothetical protein
MPVSRAVRNQVRDRLPIAFEDRGESEVKNDLRLLRIYRILPEGWAAPTWQKSWKRRATGAPGAFPNFGGDPETEFFLDSVAEDLITELGRPLVLHRGSQYELQLQGG